MSQNQGANEDANVLPFPRLFHPPFSFYGRCHTNQSDDKSHFSTLPITLRQNQPDSAFQGLVGVGTVVDGPKWAEGSSEVVRRKVGVA